MTPEERDMLTDLANKIAQTPTQAPDPQADEFIRTNIGKRPDALYILTQTVLIQNLAIQQAQQELQELKQRAAQPAAPRAGSSFLGGGAIPGGSYPAAAPPFPASPSPQPVPQYAAPPGGAPSFLRSAAQTAAGVAAGALAFEGIRSLFGGGFGGVSGPQIGGSFSGAPGGETIINNYYDSPEESHVRGLREDSGYDDNRDRMAADDSSDVDIADDADIKDDVSDDSDSSFDDSDYSDDSGSSGDDFA
jgi:hypothetical protein